MSDRSMRALSILGNGRIGSVPADANTTSQSGALARAMGRGFLANAGAIFYSFSMTAAVTIVCPAHGGVSVPLEVPSGAEVRAERIRTVCKLKDDAEFALLSEVGFPELRQTAAGFTGFVDTGIYVALGNALDETHRTVAERASAAVPPDCCGARFLLQRSGRVWDDARSLLQRCVVESLHYCVPVTLLEVKWSGCGCLCN